MFVAGGSQASHHGCPLSAHFQTPFQERFRFRNHDELLCLDNTNTHLPDVIGELTSIKDTVSYPPQEKDLAWQPSKSSSNNLFQLGIY
ncbi:uncharacterized protein LOC108856673 isoform X6 [Raphanus sativus]|uniref:Uncharacterized protein LOC108856673 isoform X6 n=1 Tax=Raphanus sativus TaxID=3726 RepID=A0A6J0NMZ7_RAPSA|nr:uncharacterized protein LOC108856673 isoform X6 [Raphanus sativus]